MTMRLMRCALSIRLRLLFLELGQEQIGVLELDGRRDAAAKPVLDALGAALFVVAKLFGYLRWPAKAGDTLTITF